MRLAPALSLLTSSLFLLSELPCIRAVKHENFKTCAQSGFCKRNRAYADSVLSAGEAWKSPYSIDASTIQFQDGVFEATILKPVKIYGDGGVAKEEKVELPLKIDLFMSGVARVRIDEKKRMVGEIELRGESKARKERYNEAAKWALVNEDGLVRSGEAVLESGEGESRLKYGFDGTELVVKHDPFVVKLLRKGDEIVVMNGKGLMNVEHWRRKREAEEVKDGEEVKEGEEREDESTWWEESFGGNTDSKPRGEFVML